MSTSHTTTTTLSGSSVAPSSLDSNRDYNHPHASLYASSSVSTGSLHYALPPQSHPRNLLPSQNNDPGASSSSQPEQHMFRSPTHDLSQQQDSRSNGKRKQSDVAGEDKGNKKRKQSIGSGIDTPEEVINGDGHGAKHWTDDEKTKFFIWLLGSDEHWDAFGTKMNTCFRECAQSIFAGRKTFTALKSCYHRNLETFKQLSAFEQFNGPFEAGLVDISNHNERQNHFEKRLETARNAGCPIGNLSHRVVDSWIRNGWFDLFKSRFYGDLNRTLAPQLGDAETRMPDQSPEPPHMHTQSPNLTNGSLGSTSRHQMLPPPPPHHVFQPSPPAMHPQAQPPLEQTVAHLSALTQNLIATYAQMVQSQSDDSKTKLEYMKRREEREEEDSRLRREMEKRREEREIAEWEGTKERETIKQRAELATQLLGNPDLETGLKQAAGEYLKQLFTF